MASIFLLLYGKLEKTTGVTFVIEEALGAYRHTEGTIFQFKTPNKHERY